jgi:hypothetical protein
MARPGANQRKNDGKSSGRIGEKVRQIALLLERNAIELVAQPEAQSKIAPHFPRVLDEPVVLVLPE